MSVLKPRSRLVVFRLSEDEYASLKAACEVREARSVSDFARAAVLGLARVDAKDGERLAELEVAVREVLRRLAELESGVREILMRSEEACRD